MDKREYACLNGHVISARDGANTGYFDLEGYWCPLCLGKIKNHQNIIETIETFILCPLQPEPRETVGH